MASGARWQPQGLVRLNRANSITRGLVHSWGAYGRTGPAQVLDAAGAAHGMFGSGTAGNPSGNSWQIGTSGYFLNFDDTGTGILSSVMLAVGDATGSGSPGSNTFSFVARVRLPAYGYNNGSNVVTALYGSAPNGIELRVNSTGKLELLKQGIALMGTSTGTIPLNVDCDIGVSYDGSTIRFYINGVPAGTATSAQTFLLATQYYLGYAYWPSSSPERMPNGSRIYRADVWNRVVGATEFKTWSDSCWQVYDNPSQVQARVAAAGATDTPVSPGPGALVLTGYAPSVAQSANRSVALGVGSMTFTGYAPSVTRSVTTNVQPQAGALTLAGFAPSVAQSANRSLSPSGGSLTLTGYAPTVARTANLALQPGAGALTLTGYAPFITQGPDNAPRVYAATIMRITTTNRRADLDSALNTAAPIRSTGPNAATIMSTAPVNRAADLGPATLNRTVSFP